MDHLEAWKFHSLQTRVQIIAAEHRITVTAPTLGRWYRANNIVYRKAPYKISNRYTEDKLLDLQQQFSMQLIQQLRNNVEIIYVDETSCNLWTMCNYKAWQPKDQRIFLPLAASRGASVSIIGAISTKNDRFLWKLAETNDEQSFMQFLD